ncbi:hypothetical protein DSO57_1025439 [Entomophthora muscae]|uniref:Uncharacterized protein n=1 Tax=Entomophthora muscae TaxID=34485 RepID=A0ACC2SRA8_9FUNG|nr:hypothetical protein DSO57_1025439 [Entomophthora muscae]
MRYWFPQFLPYFILVICQFTQRSSGLPSNPPATYRLLDAPFGPIHFTEYPLKPKYRDYTNNILARDPLAGITERAICNQEGPWYITKPGLFRDKYNFLPAYQIDMEPPVTPKPMPTSAAKLLLDHTNKLFGIVYITLTGVIDTIVPTVGLWLWLGKSISYLIKLAPILWWALLTQSATCQFPDAREPASQGWFPDKISVQRGPPKVDQPCNPKEKFESSHFKPANEISPVMDATKGCKPW